MNENVKVTSIEKLSEYSAGQIIRLPDFAEGQPFYARLKRPSIMMLMKAGKIPNSLLKAADSLFKADGGRNDKINETDTKEIFDVIEVLCRASFVEPRYDDLKEQGVELTDEQFMFVFEYTQIGNRALEKFRKIEQNYERAGNVPKVRKDTGRNNWNRK